MAPPTADGPGSAPGAELAIDPAAELALEPARLADLGPLLQAGVEVRTRTGGSVLAFLADELRIPAAEIAERVSTVFLDGDVVDDLEAAVLRDGARLALSGALPGLVGATLRRGGAYAAMRSAITRRPEAAGAAPAGTGTVRVKLFNLLVAELGPALLRHGFLVDADAARALGLAAPPLAPGARVLVRAAPAGGRACP